MSELLEFLRAHDDQFRRARLGALYSDFRHLRSTNPDGYEANVDAWCKGLARAAREGHAVVAGPVPNRIPSGSGGGGSCSSSSSRLVLRVDAGLLRALETKEWGRPLALGTAVREALARGQMMPEKSFVAAGQSIYQTSSSWAGAPWKLLSWGLRQIGLGGGYGDGGGDEDRLPIGSVVIIANLEAAAVEVWARAEDAHATRVDRIYSKAQFSEAFGDVLGGQGRLSPDDIDVLLKFLSRDKGMIAYDGAVVKFRAPDQTQVASITSEDATIVSLRALITDLEGQISRLTNRVNELSAKAKDAVSSKNRVSALAALRSRKLTEAALEKRSATLAQLEEVYGKLEQAADQVELVRVMEASADALRSLNARVGGVERVDDVVDGLHDQMAQVDEVGSVIAEAGQGVSAQTGVDEGEVDDELEAMEAEEEGKRKEKERLLREKREVEEAETTRQRLMELEHRKGMEEKDPATTTTTTTTEKALSGLQRLSLDETRQMEGAAMDTT